MPKYIVWEDAAVVNKYVVEAESEDAAREMVLEGEVSQMNRTSKSLRLSRFWRRSNGSFESRRSRASIHFRCLGF